MQKTNGFGNKANLKRQRKGYHSFAGYPIEMVPRDRIELPTRGFSDQIFENPKMSRLQALDSIPIFQAIFGFVWNRLEIFELDGHILGTVFQ